MNEIRVKVADAAVGQGDAILSTVGLGSCVAIALLDAQAGVGALAHVLLPSATMARDQSNPAKFPSTAVPHMLKAMRALGARESRVTAKIAGGASMFTNLLSNGGLQMGERNILATREALSRAGIPLIAQDVGGGHGRSILFHVADGTLEVRSIVHGNMKL
ncbi:MAG TPA: chemotaxis protein CheD [Gemmatimonadaceae bacterium]|nr:chemotaxis protein CheD [Gemmatimonadaceae bacterium]